MIEPSVKDSLRTCLFNLSEIQPFTIKEEGFDSRVHLVPLDSFRIFHLMGSDQKSLVRRLCRQGHLPPMEKPVRTRKLLVRVRPRGHHEACGWDQVTRIPPTLGTRVTSRPGSHALLGPEPFEPTLVS